jgi:DNA repair photolyase
MRRLSCGADDRADHAAPHWHDGYRRLRQDAAIALSDVPDVDLTVECITHRFTAGSKDVLLGWYPRTKLEMDESARTRKFGKYGSAEYVCPKETMAELRTWFENEQAQRFPLPARLTGRSSDPDESVLSVHRVDIDTGYLSVVLDAGQLRSSRAGDIHSAECAR